MREENIIIMELNENMERLESMQFKTLICGITSDDLQIMRELENKITELHKRLEDFE